MDSKPNNTEKLTELPQWSCTLDNNGAKKVTVGHVSFLTCSGLSEVKMLDPESSLIYSFDFLQDNIEYALNILSVTKDEPNEKSFRVTSYYSIKGTVAFKLKLGEADLFVSNPVKVNVESVIKNQQQQPYPPVAPGFLLPSKLELTAIFILVLMGFGYSVWRFFNKIQVQTDYKRTLLKADYPDPFTDLNIDLRNLLKKKQKDSDFFIKECETAFKKFFFRIFKKPVSISASSKLAFELRKLKIPEHKIRSIFVLQKDYKLFVNKKLGVDETENFLNQSRRNLADLKKYVVDKDRGSRV